MSLTSSCRHDATDHVEGAVVDDGALLDAPGGRSMTTVKHYAFSMRATRRCVGPSPRIDAVANEVSPAPKALLIVDIWCLRALGHARSSSAMLPARRIRRLMLSEGSMMMHHHHGAHGGRLGRYVWPSRRPEPVGSGQEHRTVSIWYSGPVCNSSYAVKV